MKQCVWLGISVTILGSMTGERARAQDAPAATIICLAPSKVEGGSSATVAADAARETFTSFLTGPSLSARPLQARLESQAKEEAKIAGCPFVLLTTIKHERKQEGGGMLGRITAGAVQQGASAAGAGGSTVGRIVGNAASGAASQAASSYANTIRNKDELTLSYRLETIEGRVLVEKREKRASKSDGEDLLTPLIQNAAEQVVTAARPKKG